MTAGDNLAIERKLAWRAVARARGVGCTQRKSIDTGAVERRHVDRRRDVCGQHAAERIGECGFLDAARSEVDMIFEAFPGFLGGDHFKELFLPRGTAHRIDQGCFRVWKAAHGSGLTVTSVPAG